MIKAVSRFLKNIGFNMIADLSTRLSKSILIIIISHFLGVSAMGSISIALTYLGFGILFSNWGFGNLLTREIARDRTSYNQYFANYAAIRVLFAILAILLINLIIPHLGYIDETVSVIKIISYSLIATTIDKLYFSIFIAFEELKYISIISFISNLLRLLISLAIVFLNGSIVHVAIVYSIMEYGAFILSTFIMLRFLPGLKIEFNLKFAFSEIIKAFPFFWIGVLVMLDTRAEIIILSLYFNEAVVGYYTAVTTILGGVTLFSEAIRNAVFPVVLRYQKTSPEKLREVVYLIGKYILVITIPISIFIYFFSEEIILLFFGFDFNISILMLRITIWSFISYSLTVVFSGLLMAYDKEKSIALSLFVSGMLTLILNIILAPIIGVVGIAIVHLLTSIIMFLICLYFLYRTTGYGFVKNSTGLSIILASLSMLLVTYSLYDFEKWFAVLIGLVSFLVIVFFSRVLQPNDFSLWHEVSKDFFRRK